MTNQVMMEMPKYLCTKTVWALKIKEVTTQGVFEFGNLVPENTAYQPIITTAEYMEKHKPVAGGYYVVYADGYKSFSPAEAFESGYEKIQKDT